MRQHLQNIDIEMSQRTRNESIEYDVKYINPFRIMRDVKIKNALRMSLLKLLKRKLQDGSIY